MVDPRNNQSRASRVPRFSQPSRVVDAVATRLIKRQRHTSTFQTSSLSSEANENNSNHTEQVLCDQSLDDGDGF